MKRILWLLVATLCVTNTLAIDQLGIAYRYNGKKQRTPIGGVYVKVATSRNGVVSDKQNGQFVLKLDGLGMGDPLGMATVSKRGMVVLNKEEVATWIVQKKPLVLILCDANEFQKLKDRLMAIGRSQAKKKHKQELAKLEALNAKKQLTLEQYYAKRESIDKKMEHALAHMDEYADLFARIDESEIDAVSQKAFDLFKQGYIDKAIDLFKKNEQKAKMPSIREKTKEMRQLADSAESLAQQDIDEYTKQAKAYAEALSLLKKNEQKAKMPSISEKNKEMRQLADSAASLAQRDIDESMKQAKAYVEALKYKGEWEEAGRVLKELADALGTYEAMMEYADFARRQNQYAEAETYYKLCKDKIAPLVKTNPELYEPQLAKVYINLGVVYYCTKRFNESEQMHKAAIAIYERLYEGAPQQYQSRLAKGYFDYGMAMLNNNKSNEAIEPVERSLKLCKDMMSDKPDKALYAANLSCLVGLHNTNKDYATAYTYNKELLPLLKANYGDDAAKWKVVYSGQLLSQSFYANVLGKFEEGEIHSSEALKVDSTQHLAYTNLAAAYLLQGKYQAAEKLYRQYKNELKEGFLSDFDELAKAGVIPAERKADVEKIKKMLNE